MARNPYPNFRGDYAIKLHSLHYPPYILDLVYREYEEEVSDPVSILELWQHPRLGFGEFITGHDVHRYILEHGFFHRTLSFHHLRLYEVYPKHIPSSWYGYSYILGWKGVGIDKNGDWRVPALYLKSKLPTIQWLFLSLLTNGGEVTVLEHED